MGTARGFLFGLCGVLVITMVLESSPAPGAVRYGVYEAALKSKRAYEDPSVEAEVRFEFTSPTGEVSWVEAFWDGADVWRVRFSPTEIGRWRWKSSCSDELNTGLHGREGQFDCSAYSGRNVLLTRGPIRLSPNRRHLVHSDGTPFFWLADTAWNGALKARPQHWKQYLSKRKSQGFTAVQFVSTQWRSFDAGQAFTGISGIRINPEFFKQLDAKVKAINDHGLVAAPVILWALGGSDPGHALSEADAIRLARYIVARWGAYNVVWILAGDGRYGSDRAERWKRIGRAVFGDHSNRLVTMHPGGRQWVGDEFRSEPWYSIIGYQSGHHNSEQAVRWLVEGPPASDWNKLPLLPVINLEPNYEDILAYETKRPFDALAVRRALYRSLLVSPTAGVTYGHHAIWYWTEKPEVPLAHPGSGIAVPWDQALKSEGGESVKHLSALFNSIRWWTLRPDAEMVADRPENPLRFIASARSDDGSLALIHLPNGGEVRVSAKRLTHGSDVRWFNPRTGDYTPAGSIASDRVKLQAPGDGDWVLVIGK